MKKLLLRSEVCWFYVIGWRFEGEHNKQLLEKDGKFIIMYKHRLDSPSHRV